MTTQHSGIKRVLGWSLALGCASALVGVKEATTFGAGDLENIAAFFGGGCVLGGLVGLLTTAYNEKRKTMFHIWGWALLLGLFGLVFNTGTTRGYFLGVVIGALVGAFVGSFIYLRVTRIHTTGSITG